MNKLRALCRINSIFTVVIFSMMSTTIAGEILVTTSGSTKSIKTGEFVDVNIQTADEKIVAKIERMNPGYIWTIEGLGRFVISTKAKENKNNADYTEIEAMFIPIRKINQNESINVNNIGNFTLRDIVVLDDGVKSESIKVLSTDMSFFKPWMFILALLPLVLIGKLIHFIIQRNKKINEIKKNKSKIIQSASSASNRIGIEKFNFVVSNEIPINILPENEVKLFKECMTKIQYKREWTEAELECAIANMKKIIEIIEKR